MPVYYTIFCGKRQEVFFDAGAEAPADPFFLSLPSPERFCGGGGPSTHLRGGAQPLREQVVRLGSSLRPAPGGDLCGAGSPSTHLLGAPPRAPGDFLPDEKVTKESPRGETPLGTPLGGHYHPPSGVAAPPRRTLPLGVEGGVGLCFPPRRIGVSGCRYPFLYSGKKLLNARWGAQAVHGR